MIISKQNLVLSIHPQKHVVAPTGEDNKCLASLHCRVEYLLLDFAIYDDTQRTLNELKGSCHGKQLSGNTTPPLVNFGNLK